MGGLEIMKFVKPAPKASALADSTRAVSAAPSAGTVDAVQAMADLSVQQ